jgi:hypothetical protein
MFYEAAATLLIAEARSIGVFFLLAERDQPIPTLSFFYVSVVVPSSSIQTVLVDITSFLRPLPNPKFIEHLVA